MISTSEKMTYKEFIDKILNSRGRFAIPIGQYRERHHIVPVSLGGDNSDENLIDLYAREHFIAHKLLALENPSNYGLVYGWVMMAYVRSKNQSRKYEITVEEYEQLRILSAEVNSEFQKKLWQNPEYREKMSTIHKGIPKSEEHKKKISEGNKGKIVSKETGEKISKANKGRKLTDEQKIKISEVTKGERNGMYGKHHSQKVCHEQSKRAKLMFKDKNIRWWNNGIDQVFQEECPQGFVAGRLSFKKGNKVGKYEHKKGIKRLKYKYIDEYGNIQYMDAFNQKRWHPDWELVSEV